MTMVYIHNVLSIVSLRFRLSNWTEDKWNNVVLACGPMLINATDGGGLSRLIIRLRCVWFTAGASTDLSCIILLYVCVCVLPRGEPHAYTAKSVPRVALYNELLSHVCIYIYRGDSRTFRELYDSFNALLWLKIQLKWIISLFYYVYSEKTMW